MFALDWFFKSALISEVKIPSKLESMQLKYLGKLKEDNFSFLTEASRLKKPVFFRWSRGTLTGAPRSCGSSKKLQI